ncbi:hypothetical protein [Actinomadura sp. 9N215]|uniref:hypothetical protein n=1 Tax=Actinomadura sp. 9N215 TaxID=3375150 RepID=UPI0037A898F9
MVAVVALAWKAETSAPGGAQQVERDRPQHQPGGVGVEVPGGQVCQGPGPAVGDDLLDHSVVAVLALGLQSATWTPSRPKP